MKVVIMSTVEGGSRNNNMRDIGGRSYMGQKTGQKGFGNCRRRPQLHIVENNSVRF